MSHQAEGISAENRSSLSYVRDFSVGGGGRIQKSPLEAGRTVGGTASVQGVRFSSTSSRGSDRSVSARLMRSFAAEARTTWKRRYRGHRISRRSRSPARSSKLAVLVSIMRGGGQLLTHFRKDSVLTVVGGRRCKYPGKLKRGVKQCQLQSGQNPAGRSGR